MSVASSKAPEAVLIPHPVLTLLPVAVEFRDYVAILGGLVGVLATFTGIMWMFVFLEQPP